jgi:superoxide dismutase, Fe-Mn family
MLYQMKPLPCDPTIIEGMSERLIRSHYDNNYGGTVQRLNAITSQLEELDFAMAPIFIINGLKREELIATNSMILHELVFASLDAAVIPRVPYPKRWCGISRASSIGGPNSRRSARRCAAVRAGCC